MSILISITSLEDERVYLTKLYGHGEPVDNNAFLVLDISKLKPAVLKVEVQTAERQPQRASER